MKPYGAGVLVRNIGIAEMISLGLFVLATAVPTVTQNLLVLSIETQILWSAVATLSVYVLLRMDLLTFATPAFMAAGGYGIALCAIHLTRDVFALTLLSFVLPALLALPIGMLVLRLRGTYFVLVTFVLSQITQLVLFASPLLGGSNGIPAVPAPTLFGQALGNNQAVLQTAGAVGFVAMAVTVTLTRLLRRHFAAIEENEPLAESLGLAVWRYKTLGFVIAAGIAGMAGFLLVNMLTLAHPSSYSSVSSVDYVAYAIIGGRTSILGPLVGSALLVLATNLLGSQGPYSLGLYGLLIIGVVLFARGGIVGSIAAFADARRRSQALASRLTGELHNS